MGSAPSRTGAAAAEALPLRQAIALGALHGPAELLPISSSGHVTLVPWLAGWRYGELDPELRKGFEVALHAGTAAALLYCMRGEVSRTLSELNRSHTLFLGLSFLPPALIGYTLRGGITRRLGKPGSIAAGLLAGSAAMVAAEVRGSDRRVAADAGALDGLAIGCAQAAALLPGVSRNGATLTAARARGFTRADANTLSKQCALPVIIGATVLEARTPALRNSGIGLRLAAGAIAAFGSTLACARLIPVLERRRSLIPYAIYRSLLAGSVIRRLRQNRAA